MRKFWQTLYGKISAVFLILLLGLGVFQIWISVKSSMNFVQESDQVLNVHLAEDVEKKFHPFLKDSMDLAGIEHVIHDLMVMNHRGSDLE